MYLPEVAEVAYREAHCGRGGSPRLHIAKCGAGKVLNFAFFALVLRVVRQRVKRLSTPCDPYDSPAMRARAAST
jgi:hypothetical protein